jgi:hypothetical protein
MVGQSMDYFLNKTSTEIKKSFSNVAKYIGDLSTPIKSQIVQQVWF